MSASQQKKIRKQQREEGTEKRQIEHKKIKKAEKRSKIIKSIVGIAVAVILIALIVFKSTLLYRNFTAVEIGDTKYTAAELNFFYNASVNNFISKNSQYLPYFGLDTTKSFSKQEYAEGKTWADFFKESALQQMKDITALYEEAQLEGFTLSEEDQAALASNIEGLKSIHEGSNHLNADSYLASLYGKGTNVKVISSLIEKSYIAQGFAEQKYSSYTYSQDSLIEYYNENKDNFDNFTFISYFADGTQVADPSDDNAEAASATDIEGGTKDDTAEAETNIETAVDPMENAKSIADAIVADAQSPEEFKEAVFINAKTEISETTTQGNNLAADYADWLKDEARSLGDKTVIETENGYYVLYFISRDNNIYNTVSVRHILIKVLEDENGDYTDEAKTSAMQKAEGLLDEWKAGEATEDSFAKLANQNTEDPGSSSNGGLYENVYRGQMVPEFNDWIFSDSRNIGDTAIVYSESGYYSGYHVMYFVGYGEIYRDILAENKLRESDFTQWKDELLQNYEVTTGFTARLVK